MDRAALVAHVRALGGRLGRCPSAEEFRRRTGLKARLYRREFRSYADLARAAGFEPPESWRLSDEHLLRAMRDTFVAARGILRPYPFAQRSRRSSVIYVRRWGSWDGALAALRDWLLRHDAGFPYLGELRGLGPAPRSRPAAAERRRYGEPIRFRALEHAPVNEAGVIFLFALMAADLGFIVEALGPGFPDAEAKRRMAGGEWRRVRLEFEFRSRSFRKHRHDPAQCDLIVCWEHDWPQCPVEVLELKSALRSLHRQGPIQPDVASRPPGQSRDPGAKQRDARPDAGAEGLAISND